MRQAPLGLATPALLASRCLFVSTASPAGAPFNSIYHDESLRRLQDYRFRKVHIDQQLTGYSGKCYLHRLAVERQVKSQG
jgi:hypothetical protein